MKMGILSAMAMSFLACVSGPKGQPTGLKAKTPLRLYVFDCGELEVRDLSMFTPGINKDVKKIFAAPCFLIKHPQGYFLWDSGPSDEIAKLKDGLDVRNGKIHYSVKKPFLTQLAELGVTPEDITYVAYSHFHPDHVGNANAFKNAVVFIQEEEYAAAFGPDPEKYGFSLKTYDQLKNASVQKLHGDHDVFGDGSVIIKRAIGHTPGHQVLFVELPKTGPVLLSGDLYHFTDNRIHRRVPTINFDKAETLKSMDIIEDFVAKNHADMWIQHDYDHNKTLRHAPLFYE